MGTVRLFVVPDCDVCRSASAALLREGVQFETIDLSLQPHRRPTGLACAPAVEIDGRVRFKGEVNRVLLRRILAKRSSPSAETDSE